MRLRALRMTRRPGKMRSCGLVGWLWRLLPVVLFSSAGHAANETLETLLTRLQFQQTQRIAYRETRHMQLLSEPWQATGDLYIALDRLVILQQEPQRTLTVITATHLQHSSAQHDNITRLALQQPFDVPVLKPFLLLLYDSDAAGQLERAYRTELRHTGGRWQLQLLPVEPAEDQPSAMTLSGASGLQPDTLLLQFADGDFTEWRFTAVSTGGEAEAALEALLATDAAGFDE